MRRNKKHSRLRLKVAIAIVLAVIWLIAGLFRYINSPRLQAMIYASVNRVSALQIQSAGLKLQILKREVTISNLNLFNPKKNQRFTADKVFFRFRLLPLFKGSIKLAGLDIENLRIDISSSEKAEGKRRPRIGLANLLLLRNLTIRGGVINNTTIELPKGSISVARVAIDYIPSMWGDINLSLKANSSRLVPESGPPLAVEEIDIAGETDVSEWLDIFPYVDNISGSIAAKNITWKDLDVESAVSDLRYSGMKANIKSLDILINGHTAKIDGEVDGNTQKYALNIDIPEAVSLPQLGKETSFINTSGDIKGRISIKGNGLDYKTTNATADVALSHTIGLREPLPAELTSRIDISNGSMKTTDAVLKVGENMVDVSGSFNYINPNLDLTFSGRSIPIESVLNRFNNKHYHPTKGIADVEGHLSGWRPDLKFSLSVDAPEASYYDITAGHTRMDLEMTYYHLIMTGTIYQDDREAATIDLNMQMGGKLADGTRQKTFELTTRLENYNLTPSMAEYGLTGTGNGTISLKGTPTSYTGSGTASIAGGSFKDISFQELKSGIQFSAQKITFDNISLATSEINPAVFASPIVMDITDYGIRLHGTPRVGVTVDARYLSGPGAWQIDKLTYASPTHPEWECMLKGSIGSKGELNLRSDGLLDTSLLIYLRGFVREAKGPAELKNIQISGTTENTSINGTVSFHDNELQLRNWGYYIDNINGNILFNGHSITTEDLEGRIEYGGFSFKGSLSHQNNSISQVSADFIGKSILFTTSDRAFRMEFDCDLKLKGGASSSTLAGDINILDGRYTKKFSIFDAMKRSVSYETAAPAETIWKNMKLDLRIKNSGDLKIDNNIGEVWLTADLNVSGLREKPHVSGNIETQGGEIHYAGIGFEVTRGYIEFRAPYAEPYLEFVGTKEVGDYNVSLTLNGRFDRLRVDLSSTPPLERKDILAMLTFGVTEEDLRDVQFGYQFGAGLAAEQIGSVLQRPVTKFTPLDSFRIEAAPRTSGENITRLHMGKDISDRLKIHFITDVNAEDTQQTVQADYLITDFLLLKGARMSDNSYRFHLSFRFREQ